MQDRPFKELMRMRKSLDDFGLKVKEPDPYSDEAVDYFYKDMCKRVEEAQRSNNPKLMRFSMNGYPHGGTNTDKMKWIDRQHKAMDDAEYGSKKWGHLNYGGRGPRNWKGY